MRLIRSAGAIAGALATVALAAGPASAHDCINTQKPADTGGIAGTYYIATDTFVPSDQPGNAAFVLVVLPDGSSVLSYSHSGGAIHDYVIPGAKGCDGKGLDNAEACFGL
jgi:hypothetical protein